MAGATSAGEALRAIEVRQPALVVLDLRLEGGSGLDVLDRVRAADGLASRIDREPPVIVLSGRSGDADRVRSFARGADDHVTKLSSYFLPRAAHPLHASGAACSPPNPAICELPGPTQLPNCDGEGRTALRLDREPQTAQSWQVKTVH